MQDTAEMLTPQRKMSQLTHLRTMFLRLPTVLEHRTLNKVSTRLERVATCSDDPDCRFALVNQTWRL